MMFGKKLKSDDVIFFFIASTFFLLPVRTAYPIVSISCAILLFLFSRKVLLIKAFPKRKWFLPVLFFVALPWIGLMYSKDMEIGIDYALKTKYWVAVLLTAGFVFSEERIKILIKCFWVSMLLGSGLAFLQYMGVMKIPSTDYLGFGLVYTVLSMYLLIGILTASHYFKKVDTRIKKTAMVFLIVAFTFHLSILAGRNGYFVLLIVSPFIIHNLTSRLHFGIKILAFLVLVGALSLSPVVQDRLKTTMKQLKRTETIKEGKVDGQLIRPFMYHSALKLIAQNPFIGVGTGSMKYYTEKWGHSVTHPHNNILYMGVSFGILGIVSVFWLFGKMFILSWRHRDSLTGYFIFSTCIVIFLGGIFDTLIINSGTCLLLPMGYGLLNHLETEQ